jgi:hypothetical protein
MPERKSPLAPLARTAAGFGLSVFASLSLLAWRDAGAARAGEAAAARGALFSFPFPVWAGALTLLALGAFAVGLVPVVFLGGSVKRPFATGAGVGLFWVALALAGEPYSLGLRMPAGLAIVSVFLAVLVSGAAIGASLMKEGDGRSA